MAGDARMGTAVRERRTRHRGAAARGVALVSVLLAGAGCAAIPRAPREADARARSMDVPPGRALVYVFREDALEGERTLPLYANAERIGDLPRDAYWLLEVAPGELRLAFPLGDGATVLRMEVEAGRRYFVRQAIQRWPMTLLKVQTAKLVPTDEPSARSRLGRLLRIATVPPAGRAEGGAVGVRRRAGRSSGGAADGV